MHNVGGGGSCTWGGMGGRGCGGQTNFQTGEQEATRRTQIHELVVVSAPPPRRNVTYAVRHSVPLDGVLTSRNAPYAADCGRCLKGVMFA